MVDTSRKHTFPAGRGLGSFPGDRLRKGRPRPPCPSPSLLCGTGAVTPPERAMTGRSSLRRRRAEERSPAAGTERSSAREAAGGMGAGPALAALLLAGSVLSATLLVPGRPAEPGERPHGLGAAGTVSGPSRDFPHGPRDAGLERDAVSTLGWTAVRASRELRPGSGFPGSVVGPWAGCSVRLRIHQGKGCNNRNSGTV